MFYNELPSHRMSRRRKASRLAVAKRVINCIKSRKIWWFPKKDQKIFCIGLSRTGTTSLTKALNILGYRAVHAPGLKVFFNRPFMFRGHHLENDNAFADISVIPFYKTFYYKFPNSKFILTIRDVESWLVSLSKKPNLQPNAKYGGKC